MRKNIIENIDKSIRQWISLNILFILIMLIVRIFFFIETTTRINTPISEFLNIILGIKYDLLLAAHFVAWLSPIFLVFHYFLPKAATTTYKTLIFIYAIASILLTEYFCNLMMPLDHVIFAYSVEGLKGAVESSSSFSIIPILYFIISLMSCIIISRLWRNVKVGKIFSYITLTTSIIIAISFNYSDIIRNELFSRTHTKFILATNQPSYSTIKIYDFLSKKSSDVSNDFEIIEEATKSYQRLNDKYNYPYSDYPFYRKADYQDVLGSFLKKTDNSTKPNFVFIILESFGQSMTGAETPTISFTPFIDSLKNESLYWKNCLSTTERTFGVLPAIFASVPHGEKGFAHPYSSIPPHNSLLKDLKRNDYDIAYYYGCYRDIDRYDNFLKINNIENIFIPTQGNIDEETYNLMFENNRWGLDDKELFEIGISNRRSSDSDKAFVDIYMTLSTHEPFILLEGTEKYKQKVNDILENSSNVSKKEENIILKNLNVFACYMYMDECVKNLIKEYQSLPGHENTIFVITGDHRMGMFNTGNVLRSFNVPLLIYSPLLNKNKQMDAVVSHYDISPTINAYLSNNYDYHVDEYCHWIGTSLDTVKEFRSNVKQAFMLNNRDVVDYLHDEYFLCRSKLYTIDSNLRLTSVDDPDLYQKLKKELDDYNLISSYAVKNNFLDRENDVDYIDIAEYHFDIDKTTDKVYKHLTIDTLNNKCVYFDETSEYISLYPYLEINDDYSNFIVSVSFDLQSFTENKLPLLIYSIGNFYKAVPLASLQDESLNTGKLEHFTNRIVISEDKTYKGEKLKIYLRNSSKDRMMFDNINVLIRASK